MITKKSRHTLFDNNNNKKEEKRKIQQYEYGSYIFYDFYLYITY